MYDIVHDNFTKINSSQRGNSTEEGERQREKGYKLSEKTALKKTVSFPSRGLSSILHSNLINTGFLTNESGNGFELLHGA